MPRDFPLARASMVILYRSKILASALSSRYTQNV